MLQFSSVTLTSTVTVQLQLQYQTTLHYIELQLQYIALQFQLQFSYNTQQFSQSYSAVIRYYYSTMWHNYNVYCLQLQFSYSHSYCTALYLSILIRRNYYYFQYTIIKYNTQHIAVSIFWGAARDANGNTGFPLFPVFPGILLPVTVFPGFGISNTGIPGVNYWYFSG